MLLLKSVIWISLTVRYVMFVQVSHCVTYSAGDSPDKFNTVTPPAWVPERRCSHANADIPLRTVLEGLEAIVL
eukprot:SAG31_NODE_23111_length_511_cov_0.725728_1_plen_72_part_10